MTIWQTIRKNPALLFWAVLIHVLAFIAIGVSFKASEPNFSEIKKEKIIEAVAIDESKVQAEIDKLKKSEKRKKSNQKRLQDKAKKAKKDRKKEERKLKALKKKQKEQRIKEKKHLAKIERKQKETQDKLNKLELERKEKQAKLEEEEKLRQEKIAEKKRAAEQQKQAAFEQGEVAKYKGLIRSQITRNWTFPASYQKGMKCKVLVRLIPSGDVVSVRILQGSGNIAFDRSVEMAVKKASPLPVPKSSTGLFDHFREVEFVFDPNA